MGRRSAHRGKMTSHSNRQGPGDDVQKKAAKSKYQQTFIAVDQTASSQALSVAWATTRTTTGQDHPATSANARR